MDYKLIGAVVVFNAALLGFWAWSTGFDSSQVLAETQPAPAVVEKDDGKKKNEPAVFGDEREKSFLAALNRRQKELDDREAELRIKEEKLNLLKNDIEAKLAELEKKRREAEDFYRKINIKDEESMGKIVKIFESMSPEEAAPRLEKLDEQMAVMILTLMKEKKAAKILSLVEVEKSVRLSQKMKVK